MATLTLLFTALLTCLLTPFVYVAAFVIAVVQILLKASRYVVRLAYILYICAFLSCPTTSPLDLSGDEDIWSPYVSVSMAATVPADVDAIVDFFWQLPSVPVDHDLKAELARNRAGYIRDLKETASSLKELSAQPENMTPMACHFMLRMKMESTLLRAVEPAMGLVAVAAVERLAALPSLVLDVFVAMLDVPQIAICITPMAYLQIAYTAVQSCNIPCPPLSAMPRKRRFRCRKSKYCYKATGHRRLRLCYYKNFKRVKRDFINYFQYDRAVMLQPPLRALVALQKRVKERAEKKAEEMANQDRLSVGGAIFFGITVAISAIPSAFEALQENFLYNVLGIVTGAAFAWIFLVCPHGPAIMLIAMLFILTSLLRARSENAKRGTVLIRALESVNLYLVIVVIAGVFLVKAAVPSQLIMAGLTRVFTFDYLSLIKGVVPYLREAGVLDLTLDAGIVLSPDKMALMSITCAGVTGSLLSEESSFASSSSSSAASPASAAGATSETSEPAAEAVATTPAPDAESTSEVPASPAESVSTESGACVEDNFTPEQKLLAELVEFLRAVMPPEALQMTVAFIVLNKIMGVSSIRMACKLFHCGNHQISDAVKAVKEKGLVWVDGRQRAEGGGRKSFATLFAEKMEARLVANGIDRHLIEKLRKNNATEQHIRAVLAEQQKEAAQKAIEEQVDAAYKAAKAKNGGAEPSADDIIDVLAKGNEELREQAEAAIKQKTSGGQTPSGEVSSEAGDGQTAATKAPSKSAGKKSSNKGNKGKGSKGNKNGKSGDEQTTGSEQQATAEAASKSSSKKQGKKGGKSNGEQKSDDKNTAKTIAPKTDETVADCMEAMVAKCDVFGFTETSIKDAIAKIELMLSVLAGLAANDGTSSEIQQASERLTKQRELLIEQQKKLEAIAASRKNRTSADTNDTSDTTGDAGVSGNDTTSGTGSASGSGDTIAEKIVDLMTAVLGACAGLPRSDNMFSITRQSLIVCDKYRYACLIDICEKLSEVIEATSAGLNISTPVEKASALLSRSIASDDFSKELERLWNAYNTGVEEGETIAKKLLQDMANCAQDKGESGKGTDGADAEFINIACITRMTEEAMPVIKRVLACLEKQAKSGKSKADYISKAAKAFAEQLTRLEELVARAKTEECSAEARRAVINLVSAFWCQCVTWEKLIKAKTDYSAAASISEAIIGGDLVSRIDEFCTEYIDRTAPVTEAPGLQIDLNQLDANIAMVMQLMTEVLEAMQKSAQDRGTKTCKTMMDACNRLHLYIIEFNRASDVKRTVCISSVTDLTQFDKDVKTILSTLQDAAHLLETKGDSPYKRAQAAANKIMRQALMRAMESLKSSPTGVTSAQFLKNMVKHHAAEQLRLNEVARIAAKGAADTTEKIAAPSTTGGANAGDNSTDTASKTKSGKGSKTSNGKGSRATSGKGGKTKSGQSAETPTTAETPDNAKETKKTNSRRKSHYTQYTAIDDLSIWFCGGTGHIDLETRNALIRRFWLRGLDPTSLKTWLLYIVGIDQQRVYGDPAGLGKFCSLTNDELRNALCYLTGMETTGRTIWDYMKREMNFHARACQKIEQLGPAHRHQEVQFNYINTLRAFMDTTNVLFLSIDVKATAKLGNLKNGSGRLRVMGDDNCLAEDHDFVDILKKIQEKYGSSICPEELLELKANLKPQGVLCLNDYTAVVSLVVGHDTSESMMEMLMKVIAAKCEANNYEYVVILADGGGTNTANSLVWCDELLRATRELKVPILMAHYPPYTSRRNPIESELWLPITQHWRNKKLLTIEHVMRYITETSLKCGIPIECVLDEKLYLSKTKRVAAQKETKKAGIESEDTLSEKREDLETYVENGRIEYLFEGDHKSRAPSLVKWNYAVYPPDYKGVRFSEMKVIKDAVAVAVAEAAAIDEAIAKKAAEEASEQEAA